MKKLIFVFLLFFNLVPYYYEKGSLITPGVVWAQDPNPSEEDWITCQCPTSGVDKHPLGQCPCKLQEGETPEPCPCCGNNCDGDYCSQTGKLKTDCAAECECCHGTSCDVQGRFCLTKSMTWDQCALAGGTCACCGQQGMGCTDDYCMVNNKSILECSNQPCPCCGGSCEGGYCSVYRCAKNNCPGQGEACPCCGSYYCQTPGSCAACNNNEPCSCCGSITCENKNNCSACYVPCSCCGSTTCPNKGSCSACSTACPCCGSTTCTSKGHCGQGACAPCCCGVVNCPKIGQACYSCICGDKHCTIDNHEQCECCSNPHCTGCCAACKTTATEQKAMVGETQQQVTSQTTNDPKKKCFFCSCFHYRCTDVHYIDECHECVGGNTGKQPCKQPEKVPCAYESDLNGQNAKYIFENGKWAGEMNQLLTNSSEIEHANSLFRNTNSGQYNSTGIKEGNSWSVDITDTNGENDDFVADVHTHPSGSVNCFSLGDFYSTASEVKDHPNLKDSYIIGGDGTVYAMHVEDSEKLMEFAKKYPEKDNCVVIENKGAGFAMNTELQRLYFAARGNFEVYQNYKKEDAYAYALASVIFTKDTGVKLLKRQNDGSFKEIHATMELTTGNDGKPAFKYTVTQCK